MAAYSALVRGRGTARLRGDRGRGLTVQAQAEHGGMVELHMGYDRANDRDMLTIRMFKVDGRGVDATVYYGPFDGSAIHRALAAGRTMEVAA